jgi:hypothetical protein
VENDITGSFSDSFASIQARRGGATNTDSIAVPDRLLVCGVVGKTNQINENFIEEVTKACVRSI